MELYNVIFASVFGLFLAVLLIFLVLRTTERFERRKFGNAAERSILSAKSIKLLERFYKNKRLALLCDSVALRISLINSRSEKENSCYAAWGLLGCVLLFIVVAGFLLYYFFPLWYVSFVYALLFASGIVLLFIFLSAYAANRFLKQMPQMLKYVSSRYASRKNIVKALGESVPDLPGCLRSEAIRILDALKQNDMRTGKEIFRKIERKYRSEYMTIFLDLVWNAHYYGGSSEIELQFEEILHDIMETMENRRDLAAAARSYIGMAMFFLPAIPGIKLFNSVLENAGTYYESLDGIFLLILFLVLVLLFTAMMIYMERSGA